MSFMKTTEIADKIKSGFSMHTMSGLVQGLDSGLIFAAHKQPYHVHLYAVLSENSVLCPSRGLGQFLF